MATDNQTPFIANGLLHRIFTTRHAMQERHIMITQHDIRVREGVILTDISHSFLDPILPTYPPEPHFHFLLSENPRETTYKQQPQQPISEEARRARRLRYHRCYACSIGYLSPARKKKRELLEGKAPKPKPTRQTLERKKKSERKTKLSYWMKHGRIIPRNATMSFVSMYLVASTGTPLGS